MENETIQILELFGGIGSPRCALRNLNIPTKAIDYVEINEKAVRSYNSMFREELAYKTQTVVGWNLKPDILIHGSPCQDMSIAGHQGKATGEGRINRGKGSDEGSGTRSSLMWETIHIIENMGEWRPRYVIWENVKNVKSKYMRPNFDRYMVEMERLGYTNNFEVLDAREFGLPQARERVFTVSVLNGERFEFDDLIRTPMRNLQEFLEDDASVPDVYDVTQPSVLACIGEKGIRRATVIKDCAYTITTRQDRTPAQVIDRGDGRYRYLTERECWRLMGYTDEDFDRRKQCRKETENITKHYMTKQETASPFQYSRAYSEKLFCMRSHKTGKGGKHMGNIVKTAKCRFCGQMTQIEADEELTAAQAEEQATMTCNCTDAVEYQKEKQRKEKAMQNVAALFGEAAAPDKRCGEGIVKILKAAVEEIYTGGLAKVTLNLRGGVKASISQNSKGEINVERTETKKQKLTE